MRFFKWLKSILSYWPLVAVSIAMMTIGYALGEIVSDLDVIAKNIVRINR